MNMQSRVPIPNIFIPIILCFYDRGVVVLELDSHPDHRTSKGQDPRTLSILFIDHNQLHSTKLTIPYIARLLSGSPINCAW